MSLNAWLKASKATSDLSKDKQSGNEKKSSVSTTKSDVSASILAKSSETQIRSTSISLPLWAIKATKSVKSEPNEIDGPSNGTPALGSSESPGDTESLSSISSAEVDKVVKAPQSKRSEDADQKSLNDSENETEGSDVEDSPVISVSKVDRKRLAGNCHIMPLVDLSLDVDINPNPDTKKQKPIAPIFTGNRSSTRLAAKLNESNIDSAILVEDEEPATKASSKSKGARSKASIAVLQADSNIVKGNGIAKPNPFFKSLAEKKQEREELLHAKFIEEIEQSKKSQATIFKITDTSQSMSATEGSFFGRVREQFKEKKLLQSLTDTGVIDLTSGSEDATNANMLYPCQYGVDVDRYLGRYSCNKSAWHPTERAEKGYAVGDDEDKLLPLSQPSQSIWSDLWLMDPFSHPLRWAVDPGILLPSLFLWSLREIHSAFMLSLARRSEALSREPVDLTGDDNAPVPLNHNIDHSVDTFSTNNVPLATISNFLEVWAGKHKGRKKPKKKRRNVYKDEDDEFCKEDEITTNPLIVIGSTGSGKTCNVFSCAEETGFRVIEVSIPSIPGGADLLKRCREAVKSHGLTATESTVTNNMTIISNTVPLCNTNLILLDECDLCYENEGERKISSAIIELLKDCKVPVIITCEKFQPWFESLPHYDTVWLARNRVEDRECKDRDMIGNHDEEGLLIALTYGDLRAVRMSKDILFAHDRHLSESQMPPGDRFYQYMSEMGVDIALFDSLSQPISPYHEEEATNHHLKAFHRDSFALKRLLAPMITKIDAKRGLLAGGEVITIHGDNFLQYLHVDAAEDICSFNMLPVSVYIGKYRCHEVSVLSDSVIHVRIPLMEDLSDSINVQSVSVRLHISDSLIINSSMSSHSYSHWFRLHSTWTRPLTHSSISSAIHSSKRMKPAEVAGESSSKLGKWKRRLLKRSRNQDIVGKDESILLQSDQSMTEEQDLDFNDAIHRTEIESLSIELSCDESVSDDELSIRKNKESIINSNSHSNQTLPTNRRRHVIIDDDESEDHAVPSNQIHQVSDMIVSQSSDSTAPSPPDESDPSPSNHIDIMSEEEANETGKSSDTHSMPQPVPMDQLRVLAIGADEKRQRDSVSKCHEIDTMNHVSIPIKLSPSEDAAHRAQLLNEWEGLREWSRCIDAFSVSDVLCEQSMSLDSYPYDSIPSANSVQDLIPDINPVPEKGLGCPISMMGLSMAHEYRRMSVNRLKSSGYMIDMDTTKASNQAKSNAIITDRVNSSSSSKDLGVKTIDASDDDDDGEEVSLSSEQDMAIDRSNDVRQDHYPCHYGRQTCVDSAMNATRSGLQGFFSSYGYLQYVYERIEVVKRLQNVCNISSYSQHGTHRTLSNHLHTKDLSSALVLEVLPYLGHMILSEHRHNKLTGQDTCITSYPSNRSTRSRKRQRDEKYHHLMAATGLEEALLDRLMHSSFFGSSPPCCQAAM